MISEYFSLLLCFGFALIVPFQSVNTQIENLYATCILSDGLIGECLLINRCNNIFSNITYYLNYKRDYLAANKCGWYNDWPMICCQIEKARNFSKFNSTTGNCISLQQSIIRGKVAGKYDYPWLATFYIGEPQNLFCSGVLISENFVLTVAHCLVNFPLNLTTIVLRLGEKTLSKPDCNRDKICEQDFPINLQTDIKIHEYYSPITKKNDIALIRLPSNYTTSSYVGIGCIPTLPIERRWDLDSMENFIIAGWGRTETTNQSDKKLHAVVKIVPQVQCKQIYAMYGIEIDETQICAAGLNQEDTCTGDSGASLSGLVERNDEAVELIFGITSFGIECGTDKPGVYTRISSFLEWIEENTDN